MTRRIHIFDNGVQVYDDHLVPSQRDRYRRCNVHEADEEEIFVNLIRTIPADGCFLNIGCAIGYYPLLAKRLSPGLTVHAVEPLERHRSFFLENMTLNGLSRRDFTIHEEAVTSWVGEAEFLDDGYSSSIQTRRTSRQSQDAKATQSVKTISLDALMARIQRIVHLCQMDVQGWELDVLVGARRTLAAGGVRAFLIGTHSQELHHGCIRVLKDNGYVITCDEYHTKHQPDGIVVACVACH